MDLVLDVGNTETTAAAFSGDEMHGRWRLRSDAGRTADEWRVLLAGLLAHPRATTVASATVVSVVPAITVALREGVEDAFGVDLLVIDWRTPLPVRLDLDDPTTVGADRLANVVAAHHRFAAACLAVDIGTAVTYDCVGEDGTFIGGAIAPGPATAAAWLTQATAQLPSVPLAVPERTIGRRTVAALQSGIFYGAVDAIEGMVRRIREEWGHPRAPVVATGGLAPLLAPHCPSIAHLDPDLTLQGIRLVREHVNRRVER
jgi:type III pantothenate kinase